ncbi:Uncharacterised protein [Chlamydia trachomatis]|nr:Uncharacterised protein [Chlamydia trachomatis]
MASAPILGGIIASTIPHFYFYPIMLIMVPFVLVIYFIYRKKLNGAIQNH